ncbi:MAG: carbamate kinase [Acidimicrobiales bacterium]
MRVVAALGGNALLERGEPPDSEIQAHHIENAVRALAPIARDNDLVVTHGNGPQIGLLALESARDPQLAHPYPLDVLGAQTQGMVGYWLLQQLGNVSGRQVACMLTQTLVDESDPAWSDATKFIGPVYTEEEAKRLAAERGWQVRADGKSWRRVVASPEPISVVEQSLVDRLLDQGVIVVCAGGGGVPVVRGIDGGLRGVEAVVDKDRTAGILAVAVHADLLLLLTDVPGVVSGFGTPEAQTIRNASPAELRRLELPAGSMGPKVEAVCDFVERTGRSAVIGALDQAGAILKGEAGTLVTANGVTSDSGRDED